MKSDFNQIIKEITNNDLRYGTGGMESILKLRFESDKILVFFKSNTSYTERVDAARPGRGSETIRIRLARNAGILKESMSRGIFELYLEFSKKK
ncbi:MAG: hypothetical protein O9301_02925 [Leptospira sp.]|nr:hypothetical protein [Leptospira sp.]